MHWRYASDVMCHVAVETKLWLKTCAGSKNTVFGEYWQNFEDNLQQGKSGIVINRDLGNMQHRPKAWDRQTEAYAYSY